MTAVQSLVSIALGTCEATGIQVDIDSARLAALNTFKMNSLPTTIKSRQGLRGEATLGFPSESWPGSYRFWCIKIEKMPRVYHNKAIYCTHRYQASVKTSLE